MDKNSILLIMVQSGFAYKGCKTEGYTVLHPYKKANLFLRILRELVFRLVPFFSSLFYNKEVFKGSWDNILIWDPLITHRYLNTIHNKFPNANINYIYWNMVGKASHLLPSDIPCFIKKWTYDSYDSEKYGLNLYSSYPYYKCFIKQHADDIIDVLFVGRDKGRGDYLLELEKRLKEVGLKTKFVIAKSDRLSKKKSYYQSEMSYDKICELISHSRSVLNVVMDNQKGLTLRDLEYVFQKVKLITTNQHISLDPIYNRNNVYIIKGCDVDGIAEFLDIPYVPLSQGVVNKHTFDSFVNEIINGS